jgi:signal transduction histidine kinase
VPPGRPGAPRAPGTSAGPSARALAERAAAHTLESFVRKMGHDFVKHVGALYDGPSRLQQILSRSELDRAELLANAASQDEAVRRFNNLLERTRDAVLLSRTHLSPEPVAPFVEEVRATVVAALGDRAAKLDFTADVEEELTFHADHPYLSRALVEIVKNAAEAYPDTEPRAPVRLTARARSRIVEIVVADAGRGWSEEGLSHAFIPFSTGKRDGTGLGLYIARRAVEERHGGRLILESDGRGRGTRVRIVLPRRQKEVQPRRRLTEDEIRVAVAERQIAAAAKAAKRA